MKRRNCIKNLLYDGDRKERKNIWCHFLKDEGRKKKDTELRNILTIWAEWRNKNNLMRSSDWWGQKKRGKNYIVLHYDRWGQTEEEETK